MHGETIKFGVKLSVCNFLRVYKLKWFSVTSHSADPTVLSISKLFECYYVTFPSCCPCVLAVTDLDLHILDSSKHVNVMAFAYQHLIPAYWNSLTSQLLHLFNALSNPTRSSTSEFHILTLFSKFAALHLQKENML